jgi:DNA-binding NarL/FixJ family response regulator
MTQTKTSASHTVLLVDEDEVVRDMMSTTLQRKGFEIVPAANDVLVTDLHMPNRSDGFAAVTAMRHPEERAASYGTARPVMTEYRRLEIDQQVRLTRYEQQVCNLLLRGCDNAEIAKELHIAPRAVKAHFSRLFRRFGICNGLRRIKLAIILYQRRKLPETVSTGPELLAKANTGR